MDPQQIIKLVEVLTSLMRPGEANDASTSNTPVQQPDLSSTLSTILPKSCHQTTQTMESISRSTQTDDIDQNDATTSIFIEDKKMSEIFTQTDLADINKKVGYIPVTEKNEIRNTEPAVETIDQRACRKPKLKTCTKNSDKINHFPLSKLSVRLTRCDAERSNKSTVISEIIPNNKSEFEMTDTAENFVEDVVLPIEDNFNKINHVPMFDVPENDGIQFNVHHSSMFTEQEQIVSGVDSSSGGNVMEISSAALNSDANNGSNSTISADTAHKNTSRREESAVAIDGGGDAAGKKNNAIVDSMRRRYARLVKNKSKKHSCLECGIEFEETYTLNFHKLYHEEPKVDSVFECEPCNRKFETLDQVIFHEYDHHVTKETNNHSAQCPKCGKFVRIIGQHLRAHEHIFMKAAKKLSTASEKKRDSDGVGTDEFPPRKQTRANQVQNDVLLKCRCAKLFSTGSVFVEHARQHHTDNVGVISVCQRCRQQFTKIEQVLSHDVTKCGRPVTSKLPNFPTSNIVNDGAIFENGTNNISAGNFVKSRISETVNEIELNEGEMEERKNIEVEEEEKQKKTVFNSQIFDGFLGWPSPVNSSYRTIADDEAINVSSSIEVQMSSVNNEVANATRNDRSSLTFSEPCSFASKSSTRELNAEDDNENDRTTSRNEESSVSPVACCVNNLSDAVMDNEDKQYTEISNGDIDVVDSESNSQVIMKRKYNMKKVRTTNKINLKIENITSTFIPCSSMSPAKKCNRLLSSTLVKENGDPSHFVCQICKQVLHSAQAFDKHKLIHTTLSCSVCRKTFDKPHKLRMHIVVTHLGKRKGFECAHCGLRFYTIQRLRKHITTSHMRMTINKEIEVQCVQASDKHRDHLCGDARRDIVDNKGKSVAAAEPVMEENGHRRIYNCCDCMMGFLEESSLQYHQLYHKKISENTYLKCKTCGEFISTIDKLVIHIYDKHEMSKVQCECPKCALYVTDIVGHLNEHQNSSVKIATAMIPPLANIGARVYKCVECDKLCKTEGEFERHTWYFHGYPCEKYKCVDCNECFDTGKGMINHQLKQHNMVCGVCSKPMTKFTMARHMRSHR